MDIEKFVSEQLFSETPEVIEVTSVETSPSDEDETLFDVNVEVGGSMERIAAGLDKETADAMAASIKDGSHDLYMLA